MILGWRLKLVGMAVFNRLAMQAGDASLNPDSEVGFSDQVWYTPSPPWGRR
jgi:hypothetical protein